MVLNVRATILITPVVLCALVYIYRLLASPLRSAPGPFFSRFTRFWLLSKIWRGDVEKTLIKLHEEYGKVVRIGPNEYSIDDPDAVNIVYGRSSLFRKADHYQAYEVPGSPSVFTMRSIRGHLELRKRFHETYTMTSMKSYEGYVDDNIALFVQKLHEMAQSQSVVDMKKWLQFFAFDVIGTVATAETFGVLNTGEDRESLIETIHDITLMSSRLSVFSELSAWLHRAMGFFGHLGLINLSNVAYIQDWTAKMAQKKLSAIKAEKGGNGNAVVNSDAPRDFMSKFIDLHLNDPQTMTWHNVVDMSIINITGGSDTISSTVSVTLYYLIKNPRVVYKLREEIAQYEQAGKLSNPVSFNETQQLEYLQAVIKESMRMNSAFGFPYARTVPDGGANIAGYFFPAGSVVGINPYVAHHNQSVFGADAAVFRPERWLKSETSEANRSKMEHYFLAWGLGARTCLGRQVATMEIQKLLPQLLRNFDFEMARGQEGSDELVTHNRQVVLVMHLFLKIKARLDEKISS